MNDQTKGLLITTVGVLFIVPDSLFIRLIDAPGLTISFWRSLISGAVVLAALFALNGPNTIKTVKATGKSGIVYAFFMGASSFLFVLAVENTSVANVVFILASMPIFAALFSLVFLGEAVSRRMVITIAGVSFGLAIIAYGSGQNGNTSLFGDFLALCTAACFAAAITTARKSRDVSMVPAIPIAFLGTALIIWPFTDVLDVVASQWWLIGLHGAVFIAASIALLSIGPRFITAAEVSLLMLLESVLAPLLVWYAMGEFP
ncbi:MAG: DMT family transporter, partial [Paracoccaceae bacterium]